MCQCTPSIKTPFCGKPGCEWPKRDPAELEVVIDRLEAALGANRDLDYYIAEAVGRENIRAMQGTFAPWKFTADLGAALKLHPGDGFTALQGTMQFIIDRIKSGWKTGPEVTSSDIAIAACIVALRARVAIASPKAA